MFTATPGMFVADTQPLVLYASDFGFSPSSSASQNDTAIAAALAATPAGTVATGGSIIYIASGAYTISKKISITHRYVALVSLGHYNTTIINVTGDPSYALEIAAAGASSCIVSGITFQGLNSVTSTGGGINCLSTQCKFSNVAIIQFGGIGFNLGGSSNSENYLDDVRITQCGMNSVATDGLVIGGGVTDCEYSRVIVSGNAAKNTTKNGITNNGNNHKFTNCHAYFCNQSGLFVNAGTSTQVMGGEWENNGKVGILLNGDTNVVTGANCFGNTQNDIESDSGNHLALIGNKLSSAGSSANILLFSTTSGAIADNNVTGNATSISADSACSNLAIHDNILNGATNGISCAGTFCTIHDNELTAGNLIEATGANNNMIHDNVIPAGKSITIVGASSQIKDNLGYNPVGSVTTPGFPASTVAVVNTTGVDVTAFVTNSTSAITQIQIAGVAGTYVNTNLQIGISSWGDFRIPAGGGVKFTYAGGAPTWTWFGD